MADTQISTIAPDGTRSIEAASQLVGRLLLPVGDGQQTIPQALSDRPTQADVAAYVAAAALAVSYDMGTLDQPADGSAPLDFGVL
ncbi:hypothetical protein DA075_10300 [Methylobacterium currus]|uniref:Uncharacterized protein n=1 Tax=Methylobacterium currus TaxID=2051553 RepID=A0A2R4WI83_9HYPH|nr:hypothetical protein [Methylobacterium currus]AWB21253.1 hypothetical protein DA075_10300 [Methylobacterium currus]